MLFLYPAKSWCWHCGCFPTHLEYYSNKIWNCFLYHEVMVFHDSQSMERGHHPYHPTSPARKHPTFHGMETNDVESIGLQERFRTITLSYIRGTSSIMAVFSASTAFSLCENWPQGKKKTLWWVSVVKFVAVVLGTYFCQCQITWGVWLHVFC